MSAALTFMGMNFHPSQMDVVNHKDGTAKVIAGAGSGKTAVMVGRFGRLLQSGVYANNILCLVYNRDAMESLWDRIRNATGVAANVFTFHSFGKRVIDNAVSLGEVKFPRPGYTLVQSDRFKVMMIKDFCKREGLSSTTFPFALHFSRITSMKIDKMGLVDLKNDYRNNPQDYVTEPGDDQWSWTIAIWEAYDAVKVEENRVDFDDLVYLAFTLLQKKPDVLERYRTMYQYVMVDEFQDVNELQFNLLRLLAEKSQNLMVVGDPIQCINRYCGARPEFLLEMERFWPGNVDTYEIPVNYRSRDEIVHIGNEVADLCHLPRVSVSMSGPGGRVFYKYLDGKADKNTEVGYIASILENESDRFPTTGLSWDSFAILVRRNSDAASFELPLRRRGIPFKLPRDASFFMCLEVKVLTSYLLVLADPKNGFSDYWEVSSNTALSVKSPWRMVLGYPSKFLGDKFYEIFKAHSEMCGDSLDALLSGPFNYNQKNQTVRIYDLFRRLREMVKDEKKKVSSVLETIVEEVGYEEWLQGQRDPRSAVSAMDNIREFIQIVVEWENDIYSSGGESLLDSVLKNLEELHHAPRVDPDGDAVSIATIHSSKGLQWHTVILPFLNEGVLPLMRSTDRNEEANLFYVAVTRPQERLFVTSSGTPSSFLTAGIKGAAS